MLPVKVSPRHKVVGVPHAENIANLFPAAKSMDFGQVPHIILPHQPTETYLLRKMGYDVPSPILTHYDWAGGSPFNSQKSTAALLTLEQRAYVLNGMGCGKTKSALWAWHYLRSNSVCGKMLVSAPLSTLQFTWGREIFNTLPGVKCAVLHGTKKQRLDKLADPDVEIFIINHDGHKVILDELLARTDINVLCIDELAVFRNGTSPRTRTMMGLAHQRQWAWGMPVAPIPNSPTDAWAQARLI